MSELPHGITDPLHIEPPFPTWAVILGVLLLWFVYRLLKAWKERSAGDGSRVEVPAPAPPKQSRIGAVIKDIRTAALAEGAYRRGCHQLAAVLREHCDRYLDRGGALAHLTAAEMALRLGDTALTRYFDRLSRLQFERRPPTRREFDEACDLALDVAVDLVTERAGRRGPA